MKILSLASALCSVAAFSLAAWAGPAAITIDAAKPGPVFNPRMYGIFLEEINHAVDGGLYGELIRNRAFEDSRPPEGYVFENGRWQNRRGFDSGFARYGYSTDGAPFWSLVRTGAAQGSVSLEKTGGITPQSAYCLRIAADSVEGGRLGVANEGFFGIGARQGESYRFSVYARGDKDFHGPLTARFENARGEPCSDEIKIENISEAWIPFKGTLTASATDPKTRLVLTLGAKGSVWLDFVSLFPAKTWRDRENGLRSDIAQMIADLHPGFVRFPGGCVAEAGSIETAYDWKLTVGPLERREERWGPWSERRTQGMGFLEYLQFCQDLGAEPLYVGFAGQTCIFRAPELVPMSKMGWVRDNFTDALEFANGPVDSKWGAVRAESGHPAPFGLNMVEIGNENQGPEFGSRYKLLHDALKAKQPGLICLADLSFTSPRTLQGAPFDLEDQHHYSSPRWFTSAFHQFDGRDRQSPPLYLGEVASTTPDAGPTRGNLLAALSESAFLLGCERNADVVRMVSYAPLLGHVEGRTELPGAPPPWHAMIYFDGTRAFGTASYYAWKLFGANRPDRIVQTEVQFPEAKPFAVTGQIGLGTWADSAEFKDVRVEKSDGQVLYQSDFNNKGAEGWQPRGGQWSVENGVYRQSRPGQGFSYFGDADWSDYTLTLKARHVEGPEGFLIVFGRQGGDRFWWNMGGWGNNQHGIEHNQNAVGAPVPRKIERDRWYDVKVEVAGARIRCYLDGNLVHDAVATPEQKFFVAAGREDASGDIIVKAVNLGAEAIPAEVKQPGATLTGAHVTVLKSQNLADNNDLAAPRKISPAEADLPADGSRCAHEFAPYSLTILRLKSR
jgi:alpha-L-arabinofuranosidase